MPGKKGFRVAATAANELYRHWLVILALDGGRASAPERPTNERVFVARKAEVITSASHVREISPANISQSEGL